MNESGKKNTIYTVCSHDTQCTNRSTDQVQNERNQYNGSAKGTWKAPLVMQPRVSLAELHTHCTKITGCYGAAAMNWQ